MKTPLEQAAADLRALQELTRHPGWAVLCARHAEKVATLTAEALDATATDEKANRARIALARVLECAPSAVAEGLEKVLAAKLQRSERPTPSTDGANAAG